MEIETENNDKFTKKLEEIIEIVKNSTLQMKTYQDFELVFKQTIKKLKKILVSLEIDLVQFSQQTFNLYDKELSLDDQIPLLILVRIIIAFGEEIDLFNTKNMLSSAIKIFISSLLNKFSKQLNYTNCILSLFYLNIAFSIWRKTRDHVPELYFTLKTILAYITAQLQKFPGKNEVQTTDLELSSHNQESQNSEDIFQNLFTKFVILKKQQPGIDLASYNLYEDLFFITILYIKNSFKLTNMDMNFDVLYDPIEIQLKQIQPLIIHNKFYKSQLQEIIEKLDGWFKDYKLKPSLDLIPDKPLMKIKQLTPKIRETSKPTIIQERQKLRKKIRREKNLAIKEVKQDSLIMDDYKNNQGQHLQKNREINRKKVATMLEKQNKEVKRIQSMQRPQNLKRFKRKNTRLAGNKVNENFKKKKK